MNHSKRFCSSTFLRAALFLFASAALFQVTAARADDVSAQMAPAWSLKDLDGQTVSFDQFKGKVVVVDFWATWCGPCVSEIPGYIALQEKYGAKGLVIVGISMDRISPVAVKKFVQSKGMNYTVVMGNESVVDAFGGVEGIPTTFLIDRSGKIINKKIGAVAHEEYEKLVVEALK